MAYKVEFKEKIRAFRHKGYSIKELAAKFEVSKSTISIWVEDILLNAEAQDRLQKRQVLGRYKSFLTHKRKRAISLQKYVTEAEKLLEQMDINNIMQVRLCASLLFWAEGGKDLANGVRFTNSDPEMVKAFIKLLRESYVLDESKFRALIHIHEYHSDLEIKKYWSTLINVPLARFHKSYLKANTSKRVKEGYKGCITVTYYDSKIARELRAIYNVFALKLTKGLS